MTPIRKYPRTRHLEGSRLQPGDDDLAAAPFAELRGRCVVAEEKLDGANAGLSFDADGTLRLQSRGHYLTGGPREKHFNPFKRWAACHRAALIGRLGDRYLVFGEWLYAKHTVYYDALPHYLLEFDVFDRQAATFLATDRRRDLLAGLPVRSVPVLRAGVVERIDELTSLIGPSRYKSPAWRERLTADAGDPERVWAETDLSDAMEGLYLKVEEGGEVVGRYKYVRASFLTAVLDSGSHWLQRPIVPNRLAADVDLFAGALP
ncbi:MAG: RNA ligase family protein [Gemmataceae bacterium]